MNAFPVEPRPRISSFTVDLPIGYSGFYVEEGPIYKEDWVDFTTKAMTYSYTGDIRVLMSGIDLSCNKLTGEIPPELGNLSNLHSLNLSHNKLWGGIPASFSNLKQLESLDLSYNNLNGRIPTQLTELDPLGFFKVAYNNLSGEIPFRGHFSTFDASSYQGNPLLCGPPLFKNCTTDRLPLFHNASNSKDKEVEDDGWIDLEAFYFSFAASGLTMFIVVLTILWVNPYWRRAWFYLAKTCFFSSYYFIEDTIIKVRRVRTT